MYRDLGRSTREQIAHLNGLQQMQAMLRGELPYPPIAPTLDFTLVAVGDGGDDVLGTEGGVAAEEDVRHRRLQGLLVEDRQAPLVELEQIGRAHV